MSGSDPHLLHATRIWRRLVVAGLLVILPIMALSLSALAAPPQQSSVPAGTPAPVLTPALTPATPTAAAVVPYAVTCTCTSDLFACSSFPFWSAAQACFNQCRIEVGFDIHGLDDDGDGVACELAPAGPSPFTLPARPTPTPTATLTATATITASSDVAPTATITATLPVSAPDGSSAAVTQLPAYASPTAAPTQGLSRPMTAAIVRLTLSGFIVIVAAGFIAWVLRRPRTGGRDHSPPGV